MEVPFARNVRVYVPVVREPDPARIHGRTGLLFQTVEKPKTVKNRVHMDIHVGAEERDDKVDDLVALGATRLWEGRQAPQSRVTLTDPERNEWCVS